MPASLFLKAMVKDQGEHMHVNVFVGPDRDHLALGGTVVMRDDEWLLFQQFMLRILESVRNERSRVVEIFQHFAVDSPGYMAAKADLEKLFEKPWLSGDSFAFNIQKDG